MSRQAFIAESRSNPLRKFFPNSLASGPTVKINLVRYSTLPLAIIVGCLSLFAAPVYAEPRYVSDVMHIQLRRGPGNQQPVVVSGLASGTALEFVREELDGNRISWSLVKTTGGVEGWVRSQFLVMEPTAAVQLPVLQQEYERVVQELQQLRESSVRAVEIETENQQLHENYQLLQTRADVLQAENDFLKNTDRYNQWLFGGGLLLGGVLLSFILQGIGKRKRQSDWR